MVHVVGVELILGPRAMVLEAAECMVVVVVTARVLIKKLALDNIYIKKNANLSFAVDATVAQCELHD